MKRIFKSKKSAVIGIVSLLLVLIVLINVFSSIFLSLAIFEKDGWKKFEEYLYGGELKNDSEWLSGNCEEIQVENADGKTLNALRVENEHVSHSYIIICHQYGGGPETVTEYAKHFYDLGFNIILPYMRGHGASPYNNTTLGWNDGKDILDWAESISEEDPKARIALFGVSLGANAVTLAASEEMPENVRLVIADSCYTSLEGLIKEYIKNETEFLSIVATKIVSSYAEKKMGDVFGNGDTIARLENVDRPIMFINGENDTVVPSLMSKKLYENCEAYGVEEVIVENGTHGRNLEASKETYWISVDAFILNNIGI